MADEAFALSPISARASLPGEADYAAIREAFMETARGRWFLAEYARRNRNTDTTMVLDAVARMEATLAARKQAAASIGLTESLGAIRAAIREAKVAAAEAMPRTDSDGQLLAARNGTRIIREIAWTLRECGADTRICDLLDTHIKAVDLGQHQMSDLDSRSAVLASFDALVTRIEQISTGAPPQAPDPATTSQPEAAEKRPEERHAASITPLFRPEAAAQPNVATEPVQASEAHDVPHAVVDEALAVPDVEEVEDQAVLDMIAMEMAAPDLSEPEDLGYDPVMVDTVATDSLAQASVAGTSALPDIAAPSIAAPAIAAPAVVEAAPTPAVTRTPAALIVAQEVLVETPQPPSLGAALIAGGLVPNPAAPQRDLLAAIRRMTQAEKIAFFS